MDFFKWSKQLESYGLGYKIDHTGEKTKIIRLSTGEIIYRSRDPIRVYMKMARLAESLPYVRSKLATFLHFRDEEKEPQLEYSEI